MKIFLSWSKDLSSDIAQYFSQWLPSVIQECSNPFISSDIDKGEPWFETITSSLVSTDLGLVFITPENQDSAWLNFEAGAMINKFGKSGVCPVLVGLAKSNYNGPMKNLQLSELSSEQDVKQLLATINKKCSAPLEASLLDRMFNVFWPELQVNVQELIARHSAGKGKTPVVRSTGEKLDELLTLMRGMAAAESRASTVAAENQARTTELMHMLALGDRSYFHRRIEDEEARAQKASNELRESRMSRFIDKYGSDSAIRKSDGKIGAVIDYVERNGELQSIKFMPDGGASVERLQASEVNVVPF